MNAIEIVLLVAGAIVFIISFILPVKKEGINEEAQKITEKEVKETVSKEIEQARGKIENVVDETVTYAIEKAERSMEKISNEKIMAVNEYADTVLTDINKNHKEVLFLYDMLNDKHDTLKETVFEAEKSVKAVVADAKDVVADTKDAVADAKDVVADVREVVKPASEDGESEFAPFHPPVVKAEPKKPTKKAATSKKSPIKQPKVQLEKTGEPGKINSNERILNLHKEGKSNMAIAKELGLGIGEVKLVIDLYEGL